MTFIAILLCHCIQYITALTFSQADADVVNVVVVQGNVYDSIASVLSKGCPKAFVIPSQHKLQTNPTPPPSKQGIALLCTEIG